MFKTCFLVGQAGFYSKYPLKTVFSSKMHGRMDEMEEWIIGNRYILFNYPFFQLSKLLVKLKITITG